MNDALIALQRKTVVNVCKDHYDYIAKKDAREWCIAEGLTTIKLMLDYTHRMYRQHKPVIHLEPGSNG